MKERKIDLFETIYEDDVDAICITTNGHFTKNGALMGGGCAGICAKRWPETSKKLGYYLKTFMSNVPFVIGALDNKANYIEPTSQIIKDKSFKCLILSYPTINNLMDGADLNLIKSSAELTMELINKFNLKNVILGRPGVGIGGKIWADIKKIIEPILDDRVTIVSFEHEE